MFCVLRFSRTVISFPEMDSVVWVRRVVAEGDGLAAAFSRARRFDWSGLVGTVVEDDWLLISVSTR